MKDWADEKADKLLDALLDRDSNLQAGLAEAFRQFRAETLEEAAKVADTHRLPFGDPVVPYKIAAAIRALNEKETR